MVYEDAEATQSTSTKFSAKGPCDDCALDYRQARCPRNIMLRHSYWLSGRMDPSRGKYSSFWPTNILLTYEKGGFVEIASRRLGTGEEILNIARDEFTAQSKRLAIGTRGGLVLGIEVNIKSETISSFFSVKLDPTIPKGVAFAEDGENIYVFGLYEGDM
jgi:hypothetical protein